MTAYTEFTRRIPTLGTTQVKARFAKMTPEVRKALATKASKAAAKVRSKKAAERKKRKH